MEHENVHFAARARTDLDSTNIMSDVYDSPRWRRKVRGPPGERIVLQLCVDGFPAFNKKSTCSIKPLQYFVLNYAPWLRYKSRYMLVQLFIPSHLKGRAAKKYYDWVGLNEMNELYESGVDGVRVMLYGNTLDTPGRREVLSMQAVTAFYPCPHCLHTWQPGVRKQVYGGYRRFLSLRSSWRAKRFVFMGSVYEFRDIERRPPPIMRNDKNVSVMSAIGRPSKPFLGIKGPSFLSEWRGVDWEGHLCDIMHDLKLFCEMLLKGLFLILLFMN